MAISNYTDLQSAVLAWVVRTGDAESSTRVTDFISLYESDANRRIRIRQNMLTTPLTLVSGTASVSLPSDFLEEIELNYDDTAISLTRGSFNDIDRAQTADSQAGRPSLYGITSSSITFETEADVNYTVNLRYYKKWDIATDTTNWLLTNAPDAYLFGSVAEAAMFIRDDTLLQMAIARRDAATDWVLKSDSRTKSAILRVDAGLVTGW